MAKIIHKKSAVIDKVPLAADLDYGELAINYADERVYFKNSANLIRYLGQDLEQAVLNYPQINPSLLLDFIYSDTLDPRITFTRSSIATYFDQHGVLQTANNNIGRLDHDPATGARKGFLIEEARTNSIRNNTMQGAVAGTPGTAPTNWTSGWTATTVGLSLSIVGTGTERGINYVDVKIAGTSTSTNGIIVGFDATNQIAALPGQTWTESFYCTVIAGSLGNLIVQSYVGERAAGGSSISGAVTNITLGATSGPLNLARYSVTRTLANASCVFVWPAMRIVGDASSTYDVTLRIGLPQLEQGAFATSVIPTTTTAVTRAADVASVNTLSPWYNAAEGALYVEAIGVNNVAGATRRYAELINTAINNERILLGYAATNSTRYLVQDSDVTSADLAASVTSGGALVKMAAAYAVNDFCQASNGILSPSSTSGTLPICTQLGLGSHIGGLANTFLNGHLRRVTYYPRRPSNIQLQTLTG